MFFPTSHDKSHSDSNSLPLPNLQADPAEPLRLLIQCLPPTSLEADDLQWQLWQEAGQGACFCDEVTGVPLPAAVPQGFAVRMETSLFNT